MKQDPFLNKLGGLATLMLAGAGAVCLLVFLYFLYYYGWTEQRRFSSWSGVLIYYAVPALMAALLFASLRLSAATRINIALALYSVGIAVYLLEAAASVWFRLPSVTQSEFRNVMAKAAAAQGEDFDTRSEMQFIKDLRSQGIDAGPSIYSQALLKKGEGDALKSVISLNGAEVLPIASVSNRVTVACNETGEFLSYVSDEYGFNNPPDLWGRGALDIAVLGDSFAQGFCVPREKNFVSEIRRSHPATLSLGIEGNGPLVMLASLKEYASVLKPRKVLWFYFEANDESDLNIEKQSPLLRRYLTNGFRQGLMEQQAEIDRSLREYTEPFVQKSDLSIKIEELSAMAADFRFQPGVVLDVMKLAEIRNRLGLVAGVSGRSAPTAGSASANSSPGTQAFADLLNEILMEAKRTTEEWGGSLHFVYLPAWTTYAGSGPSPHRAVVLETARRVGLPIIDIHEIFQAHSDPLALFPFRLAHHYNEEGQRLVGQEVLRALSLDNETDGLTSEARTGAALASPR
jgi:hypothetical protein